MPTELNDQDPPRISDAVRTAIRDALAGWYARSNRDLPWRRTRDPYAIWISEVMLQQTQVSTVVPYYQRFMRRFPTVTRLARADLSAVLKVWEGLGYYSRARNLHKAAGVVATRLQGRVPDTWEALRALPGIGDYIAAAVLSIAFNRPVAVVDGNVKRVLARLWCLEAPANQSGAHAIYWQTAGALLCPLHPGDHNQAVMELGATVCSPRQPRCGICPLASFCCARQRDATTDFPRRTPSRAVPRRMTVAGVVMKKNRLLLVRRPSKGLLGGLWELPNGPLEADQDPSKACAEHILGQIGLGVDVVEKIAVVQHAYTHFSLALWVYRCRWRGGRVRLNGPADFAWVPVRRLADYPLHRAVQKALALI